MLSLGFIKREKWKKQQWQWEQMSLQPRKRDCFSIFCYQTWFQTWTFQDVASCWQHYLKKQHFTAWWQLRLVVFNHRSQVKDCPYLFEFGSKGHSDGQDEHVRAVICRSNLMVTLVWDQRGLQFVWEQVSYCRRTYNSTAAGSRVKMTENRL